MKKIATIFLLFIFPVFSYANSVSSSKEYKERFLLCQNKMQKDRRSECFETLAKDVIASLDENHKVTTTTEVLINNSANNGVEKEENSKFVLKSKSNLTKDFKDPSAVQWRELFISKDNFTSLCGEVNAKNSYGAYVGFKRFFVSSSDFMMIENSDNAGARDVFLSQWKIFCSNKTVLLED